MQVPRSGRARKILTPRAFRGEPRCSFPASIRKVSDFFHRAIQEGSINAHIEYLINTDTGSEIGKNRNYEKIHTLATNLENFNKKVRAYNEKIGRFSLRKKLMHKLDAFIRYTVHQLI